MKDCNCKVSRVGDAWGVSDLHSLIREEYRTSNSLRATARSVNIAVTQAAMDETEESIVGSAEMVYDALAGDGCDAKTEAEARDQLNYAGIDVSKLTESYISHVGIKRHLNGCEDIDTTKQAGTTDPDQFFEQIREQENRIVKLVRQGLNRFRNRGVVTIGDFEIRVQTTVRCEQCAKSYTPREVVESGGCDCDTALDTNTDQRVTN